MARKPGSEEEIQELKVTALSMERVGQAVSEIASDVDRSTWTIYRWLRAARGKKSPAKATRIRALHAKGYSVPEIITSSGASSTYVYQILQDREDKQARLSAEEQVEEFLSTGRFPKRDPKDAFAWCLLGRVREIIEDDAADGLDLSLRAVEHYRSQIESRRSSPRKRAAQCLTAQFLNLCGVANRMTANLAEAARTIEMARERSSDCTYCLAEIERQCGWFFHTVWSETREPLDISTSIAHFSRCLEIYQEKFPRYGHCVYKNGISAALFGRAASSYCAGKLESGLRDSRAALQFLDPRKSPNLIVRCSHALAVFLAETGDKRDLDEAVGVLSRIREKMPKEGTIPYAKVIWLSGLIEEDGEGHLLDARDIFIEKGYVREVGTVTLDLVAYYGDRERQVRAIEALVNPYNLGAWLEGELSGVAEVLSAVRKSALTLELIRKARAKIGGEIMPDLIGRRQGMR